MKTRPPRLQARDNRHVAPRAKQAEPFYSSTEWRALVNQLIRERGYRCEAPGCTGHPSRLYGDHIRELKDGGALLDPANVMLLCPRCHGRKTIAVRASRALEG